MSTKKEGKQKESSSSILSSVKALFSTATEREKGRKPVLQDNTPLTWFEEKYNYLRCLRFFWEANIEDAGEWQGMKSALLSACGG